MGETLRVAARIHAKAGRRRGVVTLDAGRLSPRARAWAKARPDSRNSATLDLISLWVARDMPPPVGASTVYAGDPDSPMVMQTNADPMPLACAERAEDVHKWAEIQSATLPGVGPLWRVYRGGRIGGDFPTEPVEETDARMTALQVVASWSLPRPYRTPTEWLNAAERGETPAPVGEEAGHPLWDPEEVWDHLTRRTALRCRR